MSMWLLKVSLLSNHTPRSLTRLLMKIKNKSCPEWPLCGTSGGTLRIWRSECDSLSRKVAIVVIQHLHQDISTSWARDRGLLYQMLLRSPYNWSQLEFLNSFTIDFHPKHSLELISRWIYWRNFSSPIRAHITKTNTRT